MLLIKGESSKTGKETKEHDEQACDWH